MADRKTLLVLGALALLAIGLYVAGVLGPGRGGPSGGWPDWAGPGRAPGATLTPAELRVGPSCQLEGATLAFVGGCTVEVAPVTGGFPWERVTRRAILTAGPQPVRLTVTLAGKTLRNDLDPRDSVRLTYTREGGTFVLACGGVTGCVAILSEDA